MIFFFKKVIGYESMELQKWFHKGMFRFMGILKSDVFIARQYEIKYLIFMAGGYVDEEFKKLAYLGRGDLLRLNKDGITTQKISFDLRKVLESPNSEHDYNLKHLMK